jgi:hypothetical protein
VVFFVALTRIDCEQVTTADLMVVVGLASLLAVVLLEAAFPVAVPIAAAGGDSGTVATAFAMSNGVFVRIFALAPAPVTFIALGVALRRNGILPIWIANAGLGIGLAFTIGGLISIVSPAGLAVIITLSLLQAVWTVAAAIALLARRAGRVTGG